MYTSLKLHDPYLKPRNSSRGRVDTGDDQVVVQNREIFTITVNSNATVHPSVSVSVFTGCAKSVSVTRQNASQSAVRAVVIVDNR